MPTIVMDGNFVSEHLRMRNPSDDIALSDGHGFMVTSGPYETHLKIANDTREVQHLSQELLITSTDIYAYRLQSRSRQDFSNG